MSSLADAQVQDERQTKHTQTNKLTLRLLRKMSMTSCCRSVSLPANAVSWASVLTNPHKPKSGTQAQDTASAQDCATDGPS